MATPNERLKKFRKINGLTQAALGEKIGLNWSQIKDRETGAVKIDPLLAKILYYVFGVSPDWLLYGQGEMVVSAGEEYRVPPEYSGYVDKLVTIFDKGNREKVGRLKERIELYYEELQSKEIIEKKAVGERD